MGISEGVSNLSASLAVTIGQNGCAGIYPAMVIAMIAPTMGINPLEPSFLIKSIVIIAIGSFGIAGVGGGATNAALITLSALGFPVGLVAVLLGIEPLIDMGRTMLNVNDGMILRLLQLEKYLKKLIWINLIPMILERVKQRSCNTDNKI